VPTPEGQKKRNNDRDDRGEAYLRSTANINGINKKRLYSMHNAHDEKVSGRRGRHDEECVHHVSQK
jgi:hypothetical protein